MTKEKKCPFCAELINAEAIKCKHCQEFLEAKSTNYQERKASNLNNNNTVQKKAQWKPGIAALLSFVIPGAGQMYKGNVGRGLVWFFIVIIGYSMFILPGLILHIICIFAASSGNPYKS